jgi:hypothetical protein
MHIPPPASKLHATQLHQLHLYQSPRLQQRVQRSKLLLLLLLLCCPAAWCWLTTAAAAAAAIAGTLIPAQLQQTTPGKQGNVWQLHLQVRNCDQLAQGRRACPAEASSAQQL